MLQTIDIPRPSGADVENVVTALETAAIFGAKGDAQEAMRWLRRAAESAGDAGDDERALSLSRLAADLQDELSGTQPVASPTPSPSAPSPRLSYPPPPSSRAARPSVAPRSSQVPRPSSRPTSVGASRPPLALVPSQPVPAEPAPAAIEPTPAPAEAAAAPPLDLTPAPTAMLEAPAPPELTPPPVSARAAASSTGARHAARVAVAISTTKVGYLEVRLLAEGEAPRVGASEALLVMLDPTSTLLSR